MVGDQPISTTRCFATELPSMNPWVAELGVAGELLDVPERPADLDDLAGRPGDERPHVAVAGAAGQADAGIKAMEPHRD